ncbi:MAG: class I mannose-6-phosphate isomerase [Acidobacteriota bacterium]|nr:class I mannose-6-phosphate isomerase [Acidobacteriota bacterium]
MRPEPTRIEPIFSPRIWGARSLAPIYPDKTNLAEPLGEAWLTGPACKIANGPFANSELQSAWRTMPPEWRGSELASTVHFPLLVKFIFPNDQLSIQVHPDDAYARKNESSEACGKTEMWHAVYAHPGAEVLLGLIPGVDRQQFQVAIGERTLESLFQRWPVSRGDTFFVPAGTPHTIGPGVILCEIQQSSDFTYRLYDFGRVDAAGNPRELHMEKGLAVIAFHRQKGGKMPPVALTSRDTTKKSLLAACPYFASERWDFSTNQNHQAVSNPSRFELLVTLNGAGSIVWNDGSAPFQQGQCWLIPANLGEFSLQPRESTAILRTYVPNITELRSRLLRDGISRELLQEIIFD